MNDREIITEFVVESREHLADIENQFLAIEAAGADVDMELVNTVFRAVHSIKGAAGFLGFSTVALLAHDLENVLNLVRNREMTPNGTATDVLLRAADRLRSMIDDIDHSNEVDISEHIAALQRIVSGLLSEEISGPAAASRSRGDVIQTKRIRKSRIRKKLNPSNNFRMIEAEQLPEELSASVRPGGSTSKHRPSLLQRKPK